MGEGEKGRKGEPYLSAGQDGFLAEVVFILVLSGIWEFKKGGQWTWGE